METYYKGKSVLVTGGAGFIGSNLVQKLVSYGARVAVIDNLLSTGSWKNLTAIDGKCEKIKGDVCDYTLVENVVLQMHPEVVFHLAANASVPRSVKEPQLDFEINCAGTVAVLEALRSHAPTARMVLASSAAVYGEPGTERIVEATALNPISPYGASKLAAETECRCYSQVYSLPVVITRLFNSYGPYVPRFVILDFWRKLKESPEHLEILGNGRQTRDFTYVSDTVEGLMTAAIHGTPGESYNIATGTSRSVTELANILIGAMGLSGRTKISYSGKSWAGDAQYWAVDISKAAKIGYLPKVSLEDGVRKIVAWFQSQQ